LRILKCIFVQTNHFKLTFITCSKFILMFKNTFILILILGLSFLFHNCSESNLKSDFEEVKTQIVNSSNTKLPDSLRNQLLVDVYSKTKTINNDSLRANLLLEVAYYNFLLGNIDKFKEVSEESLELAIDHNIKLYQANAQSNLGYYYRVKFKNDSSFYFYNKALKNYRILNEMQEEGKARYNLAAIQADEKDYIGSEINTVKAISILKDTKEYQMLFLCYNNLAFIANQLEDYDKSIEYWKEAIDYSMKMKSADNLELIAVNGIGMAYLDKGDLDMSINYFKKALSEKDIFKNFPNMYALLVDNLAYSKFKLGDYSQLPELFNKALIIRDSLHILDGVIISNLHLAEYYLVIKDSLKAREHSYKVENLAKTTKNNRDLLASYLLLSKLEPTEKSKEYLLKHIQLSDSLQQNERAVREKFTRIAYETDEITKEKEAESKMKWWIMLFALVGTLFSVLLFINMRQRAKNKELLFNKNQDEANTEIYNLMLKQQTVFQEGSDKEKKRISEELHDGVLGRLFGTRLSLDTLNEGNSTAEIKEREEYIEELQYIEEDIRKISHNLRSSLFNSDTSFIKLVEQLVSKQSKISNFEFQLNSYTVTNWEQISNVIKINCYRILQESIQNINKYAEATFVVIDFSIEDNHLLLSINDNGKGFKNKKTHKGIGLKNMNSRVNAMNGEIEFISSIGNGTKIGIRIPL
jgi:two-component system NarL family sensor kinase